MEHNIVSLEPLYLGDGHHPAGAIFQPSLLEDQVHAVRDLCPNGGQCQRRFGGCDHRLQSHERIARAVGVDRR